MPSARLESPQQLVGELLHLKDFPHFPASVHSTDSPATMSWCGNNRLKHRSDISPSLSCKGQQPHRGIRKRFIIGSILALIATVYFCWLKSRSRLSSASFTRRLAGANESAGEEYMLLGIDLEACGNLDNAAGLPGPTTVNVLRVYSKLPEMHSDEGPALGNRADNERVEMHLDTAPGQTATARIDEWLMDPIEDLEALINAETQASTPGSSLNCSNFPLVDQNVSALTGMKGVNPLLQLSNSPSAGHLDESVSGMSGDSTVTPNDYDGLQASIDQLTSEESALIDQLLDTLDEDLNLPELPATAAGPFLPVRQATTSAPDGGPMFYSTSTAPCRQPLGNTNAMNAGVAEAGASLFQSPDQQPAKRQRTADFGAIDGRWAGAIDGRRAGAIDGRRAGAIDGRWAGAMDGRWAGAMDGRWAGAIDGRRAGATDGRWAGAIGGRWPATLVPSTRLGTHSVLAHTLEVAQFPGQNQAIPPFQFTTVPAQPVATSSLTQGRPDYATHPYYRLPLAHPGADLPAFDVRKTLVYTGIASGIAEKLHPVRVLLLQQQLSLGDMQLLLKHGQRLLSYAQKFLTRKISASKLSHAIEPLSRRFLVADALWCICSVLGPAMQKEKWWTQLLDKMANGLSARLQMEVLIAKDPFFCKLLAAMHLYRKGKRPSAKTVVLLKQSIFRPARSTREFKKSRWDPWRRDDRHFEGTS